MGKVSMKYLVKILRILVVAAMVAPFMVASAPAEDVWTSMESGITDTGIILNAVWGSSGSDVFAVGGKGTILHYDGSGWTPMTSGLTKGLGGVWGSSGSDVFAVSGSGAILHYDGFDWTPMTHNSQAGFRAVWGASSDDVFAVGSNATILHYDGTGWTEVHRGGYTLSAVWGSSGNDVFVTGDHGTILHYDGTSWKTMQPPSGSSHLNGLWGSSGTDVFAAGSYHQIIHYDGSSWTEVHKGSGYSRNYLRSIWGSSGSNVFVVGDYYSPRNSIILHQNDTAWETEYDGGGHWLWGVWGDSTGSDVFAVGEHGTILHQGAASSNQAPTADAGNDGVVHVGRYYLEGVWEKTYDFKIDGVISGKILSNKVNFTRQGDKFIGKYISDPTGNPSIFEGQGFSKQKNLIYVIQKHPSGSGFQYYGIMSSVMVNPNKFIGTWCDSSGNMGDLIWTRSGYAQEKPGRVLTPPQIPAQDGCPTLAQVYTDGSGDSRTKKLGGNYAAIKLDSLRDDQTLRVETVSGRLMYVTLHARYQGGYWRTIYKGPKTEFPVGQYLASYKKDKNCTHVNVSVNGAHEKYDPVACRANVLVCGAPDKPESKKIAEDEKKMLAKLSLGKPARQSSTGHGGTAQLAVDGNTDGNYGSGSTTHTNHEKNPWWEVDLGAAYKLENVLVYNRIDACSERLDNFQVLVSVEPFPNSPVTADGYTIKGWTVQKAQNINRINLGKTHGRYVRIQLLGQNYLSLAEVIVNGVSTETHPTGTATTGELSNIQKKLLVLNQLYREAYQHYQGILKIRGFKDPAAQGAYKKYEPLSRLYRQVKQEYIQSNQWKDNLPEMNEINEGIDNLHEISGKVITGKMKKDILIQLTNEAYQGYQDSLRQSGLDNSATSDAFDLYRLLIDVERQVN